MEVRPSIIPLVASSSRVLIELVSFELVPSDVPLEQHSEPPVCALHAMSN